MEHLKVIKEIIWPYDRIEHIAMHQVTPDEFEDVCFGDSLILRTKSEGKNPVYFILDQTLAGRYLACVVIQFPDGKSYPVTAREMTENEKRRYKNWRFK